MPSKRQYFRQYLSKIIEGCPPPLVPILEEKNLTYFDAVEKELEIPLKSNGRLSDNFCSQAKPTCLTASLPLCIYTDC